MTVCAGACALTATAQSTWVTDSFEAPEGTNQNPIAWYKMTVSGTYNETTNFLWTAAAGDASKLVPGAAADSGYAGVHPIVGADQALVLNLETEGQTLSRTVGDPRSFSSSSTVYVDTLIKFTPSEDTPTIGSDVKVAVYVNVNSNLVVWHKTDLGGYVTTNSVFPELGIMDPTTWYRLTIQMGGGPDLGNPICKIFLNGQGLTNELAFTDIGDFGGAWFMTVDPGTTLSTVAFQGTGAVDELTVSDIEPDFGGTAAILLTLMFDTSRISVTKNGTPVNNYDQVATDSAIVINAKPWYELTAFGALFTGGDTTNKVAGTAMITNINGVVTAATAGLTNEITAALYSDTGSISTGLGGSYPANLVAAWASGNGLTPEQLTTAMMDDYLLNVAPATDAEIQITSIVYDEANAKAVITVGATLPAVNFTTLNGTLVVWTTDDLATPFALAGTYTVTLTSASQVTIDVPTASGTFIKARVQ